MYVWTFGLSTLAGLSFNGGVLEVFLFFFIEETAAAVVAYLLEH